MKRLVRMALRDVRGGIIGWSIGLGAMTLLIVASYPSIEDQSEFDDLWKEYQESLGSLFGDCPTITDFDCYMDTQVIAFLPVLMGIFAVIHASRLLAGEEESGRLDMLLSAPVSRGQVVASHIIAIAIAQAIVGLAVSLCLVVGALAVGQTGGLLGAALVGPNALPAVLVIAFVTYFASALWHSRRVPAMVGTLILVASYFLGGLAPLVDLLRPLRWASITYLYQQSQPMRDGLDPLYFAIALPVAALLAAGAWLRFRSKDLTG